MRRVGIAPRHLLEMSQYGDYRAHINMPSPLPEIDMQAVVYEQFGDESVLNVRDIPALAPARDEVQVKVRVASLNPVDFKLRSGMLRMVGRPKRPAISGKDFAGVIAALGQGVRGYEVGQRVFGSVDPMGGAGSCAEFVSLSTDLVAPIPDTVSDEVAACLPVASGTAFQVLTEVAHLQRGQTVLITGASGAVGASAVQLARSIGANITGVCGTANVAYVLSIGVNQAIDYKTADWRDIDTRYDVIFDAAASATFSDARARMSTNGIYINTMPRAALFLQAIVAKITSQQRCVPFLLKTNSAMLKRLGDLADKKVIVPLISEIVTFNEVALAQRRMQQGQVHGKICVRVEAGSKM